jgi:hypothetical protein
MSQKLQSSSANWVVAGQPTYPTITSVDLAMYLSNSLLGEIKGFKTRGIITREMKKKKRRFFGLELGFPIPEHFWAIGGQNKFKKKQKNMKKKLLLGLRKNITNLKDKFVEEETQSGEQDGKKGYKNKILNLRISLLIPIRPTKKIPPTLVGNPPRC